jgi:hypothetical protein
MARACSEIDGSTACSHSFDEEQRVSVICLHLNMSETGRRELVEIPTWSTVETR